MPRLKHPEERLAQSILYKGVEFEIVERPDITWVGCVDYAAGNDGESDIGATLERYQSLLAVAKRELIQPEWSAALSINYCRGDQPSGLMFAQETYPGKQDERYDLFVQPGGLWLRMCCDENAAALLENQNPEPYEYFAGAQILQSAAKENGYTENLAVPMQVEYHCSDKNSAPYTDYVYIPVIKV